MRNIATFDVSNKEQMKTPLFTKEQLNDMRSSWILPDGTVYGVWPAEQHDNDLPNGFKDVKDAEKKCIRVSCNCGYESDISYIHVPDEMTLEQRAIVKYFIDNKIITGRKIWTYHYSDIDLWDALYPEIPTTKEELQEYNKAMFERIEGMKKIGGIIDYNKAASSSMMNLHEAEKISSELLRAVKEETSGSLRDTLMPLIKNLDTAFDDIFNIYVAGNREGGEQRMDDITKKYAHNIPSVIKDNDMIVTHKNNVTDKYLLGNKGAGIMELHGLELNVPPTLFLTTRTCKLIDQAQGIDFYPLLKKLLYMFDTDKIAIRSSGVVSMPGMMDTVLDIDRNDDAAVQKAILGVVNSWNSERAKRYRAMLKMDNEIKIAVLIQPVIRGDKGYSGIVFSRDVNTGKNILTGEFVKKSLGDALASGSVTPIDIRSGEAMKETKMKPILVELNEIAQKLEKHFKAVQDIEFVNDGKTTYIVQTRNAKLSPVANVKTLIDFVEEGVITKDVAKFRFNKNWIDGCKEFIVDGNAVLVAKGTPVVNGICTGQVVFGADSIDKYPNPILLANITTTEDLPMIQKASALVTQIGGFTSHPAVVCRELKKPCVVGASDLSIEKGDRCAFVIKDNAVRINEGDVITVIGNTGEIYFGKVAVTEVIKYEKEIKEILS